MLKVLSSRRRYGVDCKPLPENKDAEQCVDIQINHCLSGGVDSEECAGDANSTEISSSENVISSSVLIEFHHNFTNILKCVVYFRYEELPMGEELNVDLPQIQTFRVKFLEMNET